MLPGSVRDVRAAVAMESESDKNDSLFPGMSYKTRLTGFFSCFACGIVISVLSIFLMSLGNIVGFAIFYTLGNIVAMSSTLFLMGPKKQCGMMWKKDRAVATSVYLVTMILTLVIGIATNKKLACIILLVIQSLAATWYSLSYIPFARQAVTACCKESTGVSV